MIKYTVVCDDSYPTFVKMVETLLSDGWELQGGICMVPIPSETFRIEYFWSQALTRVAVR